MWIDREEDQSLVFWQMEQVMENFPPGGGLEAILDWEKAPNPTKCVTLCEEYVLDSDLAKVLALERWQPEFLVSARYSVYPSLATRRLIYFQPSQWKWRLNCSALQMFSGATSDIVSKQIEIKYIGFHHLLIWFANLCH